MRWRAGVALVGVVALGMTWRSFTTGEVAKLGADALYALAVFTLLLLARPPDERQPQSGSDVSRLAGRGERAASTLRVGGVAVAVCWVVEFSQLTPWPAELSARSTAARLVLGSTFHAPDLAAYVVGAAIGAGVLRATMRA